MIIVAGSLLLVTRRVHVVSLATWWGMMRKKFAQRLSSPEYLKCVARQTSPSTYC